jgi:phosphoglycolate phosphatase (TIGR01487 family)
MTRGAIFFSLPYKAFVLDVDGTICDYEGMLSLEAAHSIRWLRNLGFEVILASGRGPWDTFYLGVYLGCTKIAVCENGGVLMTSPTEMKLFSDKSESLRAYDALCRNIDGVELKPVSARLTEVVLLRTFDLERGQEILKRENIPVVINDSKFAFHLTRKGINKAVGLSEALKVLNVGPEETVVIGDSETDIPMFDLCGYAIAVGNATPAVKSKADFACSSEMGDGVVEAISHVAEKFLSGDLRLRNELI